MLARLAFQHDQFNYCMGVALARSNLLNVVVSLSAQI